jgi:hypothetical protein
VLAKPATQKIPATPTQLVNFLLPAPISPGVERSKKVWRRCTILAGWLSCVMVAGVRAQSVFDIQRKRSDEGRIGSVEQYIAALPAEWRENYVLVHRSRSLQGGSYSSPRAILFGRNAEFVASFNGDPAQRGYSAVETMEFDSRSNQFLFREIQFPPVASGSGASATVTISEPNPARCIACHDRPARPIWDLPPSWPGVYGERYRAGLSAEEAAGMREFLGAQPAHSRYRYLLGAEAWAGRERYVRDQHAAYNGSIAEPPNERLSVLLANLNTRRILFDMAARPQFQANAYLLLAAAGSSCGSLAQFRPGASASDDEDFARFAAAAREADKRQAAAKAVRRTADAARYGLAAQNDLTRLRYVVERELGLSTEHWTLALERGTYDMSLPEGSISLEQALFQWLAPGDPTLRHVAAYRTFDAKDAYCEHLRNASRRALEGWNAQHPLAVPAAEAARDVSAVAASTKPALLDRCILCHTGEVAPRLPFADPLALGPQLLTGDYPRGRLLDEILYRLSPKAGADSMPRGLTLDAAERRSLEQYFLALARPAPER